MLRTKNNSIHAIPNEDAIKSAKYIRALYATKARLLA